MISIHLTKTYSRSPDPFELDIALDIPDACRKTVFFGPSGSGKTQTLHCLAGLTIPDAGRIVLDDTVLYDSARKISLPARRRRIGYMFQEYALFPHMTVLQNVAYAASSFLPFLLSHAARKRAGELLDRFHLSHVAGRFPHELSGGQRQRVALIRALNAGPRLLLLDEPFSALDPLLRRQLRSELLTIVRDLSIPTICITHDPDDVDMFTDMLVLYTDGHAQHIENYAELRKGFSSTVDCLLSLQHETM